VGLYGEFVGFLLIRVYYEDVGEYWYKVFMFDIVYGINLVIVMMVGYEVVKVVIDWCGGVDFDDLCEKVIEDVVLLMLINLNMFGLFDENIDEIGVIVYGVGGILYYDGVNLNVIMGWMRFGDMGFDIVYFNFYKLFS